MEASQPCSLWKQSKHRSVIHSQCSVSSREMGESKEQAHTGGKVLPNIGIVIGFIHVIITSEAGTGTVNMLNNLI